MTPRAVLMAMYLGIGLGFAAGKLDLDDKIRESLRASQLRMAKLNARTLVDEMESRKVGIPVGR